MGLHRVRECMQYLARWDVATPPSVDSRYGSASNEAARIDIPHDEAMMFAMAGAAGFTIFPHIVAIVHTDPYVDLYHYYRRRTLAKVPRHFSFYYFFWQTGAS